MMVCIQWTVCFAVLHNRLFLLSVSLPAPACAEAVAQASVLLELFYILG